MNDERSGSPERSENPRRQVADDNRALLHYDRFFELSFDLLCIAGFDGHFKLLSPSWSKTLGYALEELYAEPFVSFVHPEDREATARETARLSEGAITISFDNRYRAKDGSYRWLYWSAVPDMEQSLILAVARDITERKRFEGELRAAKDAAESASRAKSEFLARMSHELRTPLNSVIGFSDVMLYGKGGELSEVQRDYLSRVRNNGEHLLALINQVLDLAKIEARKLDVEETELDLGVLVKAVALQFEGQLHDRSIELALEVPDNLETIVSDVQKVRQVLINLVGNAVKFTQEGSVTLRIGVEVNEPRRPAYVEVEDTGIGIPEQSLNSIFETFEQADHGTSRSFEGTGLGLAICRSLCELLGYELSVKSTQHVGTTFRVDLNPSREGRSTALPAVRPVEVAPPFTEAATVEERVHRQAAVEFSDKLVLVVDDDADARMLLTHALHELGCQVLTATSGEQALRLASVHRPDLITLDLLMPEVTGWDLLAKFRASAELRHVPVVVVSGVAREADRFDVDALEVLEKPVSLDDFRETVVRGLTSLQRRVLVVDDSADDRELMRAHLDEAGAEVATASGGAEALELLEEFSPEMVVVDLVMPDMNGAEFVARLRQRPGFADLPVILVTAKDLDGAELEELSRATAAVLFKGPGLSGQIGRLCSRLWSRTDAEAGVDSAGASQ